MSLTLASATRNDVAEMLKVADELQNKNTPEDNVAAFNWFQRAAEFGDSAWAMCSVGHCFQVGLGVHQDIDKAMVWFRRAASKMGVKRGPTLCHVASQINRHAVAAMFIAMGGDVNACDSDGATALHAAAQRGQLMIAKMLIAAGADVNAIDKRSFTVLHYAVVNGDETIVEMLVAAGADWSVVDAFGSRQVAGWTVGWTLHESTAR